MEKKTWEAFFEDASSMVLTESLSWEEYNKKLTIGEYVPVTVAFEDWPADNVESLIKDIAVKLSEVHNAATPTLYAHTENAIEYFEGGFIEELTTDKKFYVQILIEQIKQSATDE